MTITPLPGRVTRFLALLTTVTPLVLGGALAAPASAAPTVVPKAVVWVRAAHLVPEVGTMTIRLVPFSGSALEDIPSSGIPEAQSDGATRVLEPAVGYGGVGEYRQVPAGLYAVTVRPVGASTDTPPVVTGTFMADPATAVTLAAVGSKTDPRVQAIIDDCGPPPSGQAAVRLVPAVPDAPAMTVVAKGGPTIGTDVAFAQPTEYATVPMGPWTLVVTTSAGDTAGMPATASVDVADGGVYTVFVLADGAGGVTLKAVADAQGAAGPPRAGVQTGGGGLAERPVDPVVLGGLALAALGASVLLALGVRRRPVGVVAR